MVTTRLNHLSKPESEMTDASQSERLEYYERQLIDMKIRLDALEIQGIEQKTEDPNMELKQFLEKLATNQVQEQPVEQVIEAPEVEEKPVSTPKTSHVEFAKPYRLRVAPNHKQKLGDIT